MQDLGAFHSLGDAWIGALKEIEDHGTATIYTDNVGVQSEARELIGLIAEMQNITLPDAIIEKYKVQEEYDWMVRNFTVQEKVPELYCESSYASRMYSYMGQKDQMEWLVGRLRNNPTTRAAAITMFEPLSDDGYIPCVSLLDFQEMAGKLNMIAYCRALDFGCKAYTNLVMLHWVQKDVSEKVGIPCGKLTLIVKSAHFYIRDRDKILQILREQGMRY